MVKAKYSLEDRIDYYNDIVIEEYKKGHKKTAKCEYALGYLAGTEPNVSLVKYKDASKIYKKGLLAGCKAVEQSRKVKF